MDDLKKLLNMSVAAALKAGLVIMDVYRSNDYNIRGKADDSPVTSADIKADEVISSLLKISGLPVLSEEGRHVPYGIRKVWKRFWLIDPLDGTKEFINGTGEFTVNIALVVDRRPLAGVVYVPVKDILYAGIEGIGSFRFDKASELNITTSGSSPGETPNFLTEEQVPGTNGCTENTSGSFSWPDMGVPLPSIIKKSYGIVGSRSFRDDRTSRFIAEFSKRFHDTRIITRGSSLKLCMLAEGEADIYPRFTNISEWDTAAGHAIVLASGGSVVQAANTDQQLIYNKEDFLNPWFIGFRNKKLLKKIKGIIPIT